MPTYLYRRSDGTEFDFFQKMSDSALTVCPTTGQAVTRVITGGTGVLYKGEGWYITDYKRAGETGKKAAPAPDKAENEVKKTDTTPSTTAAPASE